MTNADVSTKDKIVELENRIQDENPYVIMISEVKPKNLTHNNNEETRGRGMCM